MTWCTCSIRDTSPPNARPLSLPAARSSAGVITHLPAAEPPHSLEPGTPQAAMRSTADYQPVGGRAGARSAPGGGPSQCPCGAGAEQLAAGTARRGRRADRHVLRDFEVGDAGSDVVENRRHIQRGHRRPGGPLAGADTRTRAAPRPRPYCPRRPAVLRRPAEGPVRRDVGPWPAQPVTGWTNRDRGPQADAGKRTRSAHRAIEIREKRRGSSSRPGWITLHRSRRRASAARRPPGTLSTSGPQNAPSGTASIIIGSAGKRTERVGVRSPCFSR